MIPPVTALTVSVDGVVTVVGVAAAGSVPAGAAVIGGNALTVTGGLYVVFV